MNADLVRFVREALTQRVPKPEIRFKLVEAQWPEDEVDSALDAFADIEFPIPIPRPKVYLSARDAFLYLALFTTLYTSAVNLGMLLYQFINRAFPDPAMMNMAVDALGAVRWPTASLIIAFPVFLILSRHLYRATRQNPEKRTSKIRKWLTYLTLFVAAGVVLGDLIALVFNVLGGEFTTRFILKVLTVGGIAGSVFGFYLWDLRQDDVKPERATTKHVGVRVFTGLVTATVGVAIVCGLILAGSPGQARLVRFDDRRGVDLQMISRAVDVYWSQNQQLPADLEQLSRERGVRVRSLLDPATAAPYEYRTTGETSYELCAIFDRRDERPVVAFPSEPSATGERFWAHDAGRVCFALEAMALRRVVVEPEPTLEDEAAEPDPRD